MDKVEINAIVRECLRNYLESQKIEREVDDNTALIGNNSIIDSMGLVNVIIDIESRFLDMNIEISLASEQAMSRRNSPFRSIVTLSEFIQEQIKENHE